MISLMPPLLLGGLLALTGMVAAATWAWDHRRQGSLRTLARLWRLHFVAHDAFRLSSRVARELPFPGAADVAIGDVIYGRAGAEHCYLFTVHYTMGLVGIKRRRRCIAGFVEPSHQARPSPSLGLKLADNRQPLIEQYDRLRNQLIGPLDPAAARDPDGPPAPWSPAR